MGKGGYLYSFLLSILPLNTAERGIAHANTLYLLGTVLPSSVVR